MEIILFIKYIYICISIYIYILNTYTYKYMILAFIKYHIGVTYYFSVLRA